MTGFRSLIVLLCCCGALSAAHDSSASRVPVLVPLTEYVVPSPVPGGSEHSPTPITLDEAMHLKVLFNREKLPADCGVQFLTVTISIFNKKGGLTDKITKHAFTFPFGGDPEKDRAAIHRYAEEIIPFGFVSENKVNFVTVLNDTVAEWSMIKIEITPDDDYTKFAERLKLKQTWWYRVKGSIFEEEFFLGIPKVLYDSERNDTLTYGSASAMLRFYYLNPETGHRFPLNIGIGTFGVSNPIDVTSTGGGFALSLLWDVVQSARLMYDLDIPTKVNAGIEVTPFFPVTRRARILINARIGYAL